jgi:hypothetical protein
MSRVHRCLLVGVGSCCVRVREGRWSARKRPHPMRVNSHRVDRGDPPDGVQHRSDQDQRSAGTPSAASPVGAMRADRRQSVIGAANQLNEEVRSARYRPSRVRSDAAVDRRPLNIIYGIGALDDANVFVNDKRYIFTNLNTLGFVLIILGVIQLGGGFSLMAGNTFGRSLASSAAASARSGPCSRSAAPTRGGRSASSSCACTSSTASSCSVTTRGRLEPEPPGRRPSRARTACEHAVHELVCRTR